MSGCSSIPSRFFPSARLCKWMTGFRARSARSLDVGTTYVDLKDPKKPRLHREKPDGKVTPREVHQAAVERLEEEWRRFFRNEFSGAQGEKPVAQPVAEALYDQFHFLPPWLPKPWNRMTSEEHEQIQKIVRIVRARQHPSVFVLLWGLEAKLDRISKNNELLNVLKVNGGNCMGLSHVFYFAQAIVLGRKAQFRDVYWQPGDQQMNHVAVMIGGELFDPTFGEFLGADYRHYALTLMDEWALSLLHVAEGQRDSKEDPAEVEKTYRLAHELAPHHFRIQLALGGYLFSRGNWEESLPLYRAGEQNFPVDPDFSGYLDFLEWHNRYVRR